MKEILIIGQYPLGDQIKDGMAQRIKMIDTELTDYSRTYLCISYRSYLKKQEYSQENLKATYCNFFLHRNLIQRAVKKASRIYCHSLYNLSFLYGMNLSGKQIILDVHGSVPEELEFRNDHKKNKLFSYLERQMFPKVTDMICVSESMKKYYNDKYPALKANWIIKPIMPINSIKKASETKLKTLKERFQITDESVVFLYSGNLQKWQNFDLMVKAIESVTNANAVFIILTGQQEEARKYLNNLDQIKVYIDSVAPEELPEYYELAHYGFLLRDEIILNKVAAPTKLFEYLFYGITPIMKTLSVGDFALYNCDYVAITDNLNSLRPYKSKKNRLIAQNIKQKAEEEVVSKYMDNKS